MLVRPPECQGCLLHDSGVAIGYMATEGTGALGLAVYAEALGEHEANDGLPLRPHAQAGGVFDRAVRKAGINRSQLMISNVVKCRPGKANLLEHQPYEFAAINHCKGYMDREIDNYQPKAILALGNVALRTFTGYCGRKKTVSHVRGFVLDNLRYLRVPVISTYHPAFLARDKSNLLGVFRTDILRAKALAAAGGRFIRPSKEYIKFPGIAVAEQWLAWARLHPELPINYDIETDDSISGVDESELRVLADGAVEHRPLKEAFIGATDEEKESEEAVDTAWAAISSNTRITQIQFSIRGDGDALVLPWKEPFIAVAKAIMELPNEKHGWNNYSFDDPILRMHGAVINGIVHDLMLGFHHLQPDIPRGLQYATSFHLPNALPWKDKANDDPGEYGGDDVSYPRRFGPALLDALRQRGLWNGYERHIVRLWPILSAAADRGIPVDDGRRVELGQHVDGLRAGVDQELQGMFPDECRNCEPKLGYVRWPQELMSPCLGCNGTGKVEGIKKQLKCDLCKGKGKVEDEEKAKVEPGPGERWVQRTFINQRVPGTGDSGVGGITEVGNGTEDLQPDRILAIDPIVGERDSNVESIVRWCRLQPFLPNSSKQILAYIRYQRAREIEAKVAGYKASARFSRLSDAELAAMAERNALYGVPKKFREDKETTEKKELERLGAKTKDSFFSKVVEHREYGKIKGTYVDGWWPWPDGRVHATFSFGPATGQLASSQPATMTGPKPGGRDTLAEARKTELAERWRSIIVAPPGYKLLEFDMKSFHALTLGYNAKDLDYMRIAALDIHSFVTANFMWLNERAAFLALGLPGNPESWVQHSDEELMELLGIIKRRWKPIRDKKAKPTILGIGLGLGDAKCFEMNKRDEINPRGFESKAEVTRFKHVLKGMYPKIFQFHESVLIQADEINKGFLKSAHGYMRWFFDIFRYKKVGSDWLKERGADCEKAIAFYPQNDAHGMFKESLLEMDTLGLLEQYGFVNPIHDALMFVCPSPLVEEALHRVYGIMNQPSRVLIDSAVAPGGLRCGVEAMVGESWDKMEVVKV